MKIEIIYVDDTDDKIYNNISEIHELKDRYSLIEPDYRKHDIFKDNVKDIKILF